MKYLIFILIIAGILLAKDATYTKEITNVKDGTVIRLYVSEPGTISLFIPGIELSTKKSKESKEQPKEQKTTPSRYKLKSR